VGSTSSSLASLETSTLPPAEVKQPQVLTYKRTESRKSSVPRLPVHAKKTARMVEEAAAELAWPLENGAGPAGCVLVYDTDGKTGWVLL
jgi:hypothetical protein